MPDEFSIKLREGSAVSQAVSQQAFEAARRAILRCGARGFDGVRPGFYRLTITPGQLTVPVEE